VVRSWLLGSKVSSCSKDRRGTYHCVAKYSDGVRHIYWNPTRSCRSARPRRRPTGSARRRVDEDRLQQVALGRLRAEDGPLAQVARTGRPGSEPSASWAARGPRRRVRHPAGSSNNILATPPPRLVSQAARTTYTSPGRARRWPPSIRMSSRPGDTWNSSSAPVVVPHELAVPPSPP
jgi:hypothetical protein